MSKFLSIDHFKASTDNYKILPFKFERLNDKVFISNLIGEYLLLKFEDFDNFINGNISKNSDVYYNLQSKHFIIDYNDQSTIELLALKLRTKYARLSNFTALHMFVVTLRCEHSCPYCQVSRQSEDRNRYDMSEETALKSLDLVFRSPSPSIKIEFQGGEPLLNFKLIKFVVNEAINRNKHYNKSIAFVIATNLALINDEVISFSKQHKIQISTSIDGPRDLHNANRPRPGNNSFELAEAGIRKIQSELGVDYVSALMTTTKNSINRVKEIIDEYIRLGFEGIFLRPLSPYGFAIKTKWYKSYDLESWLDFYFEGLDYIIELNKNGFFFREFYARTILIKMLTPFETGYVDMMNPAGLGIAAIVYNYNGDVYASDESRMLSEMGDDKFKLGNVSKNSYQEIFTNDILLESLEKSFTSSAPMCSDCAYEIYCGADPVYHYTTQNDVVGTKWNSGFCSRNITIFRRLIEYLQDPIKKKILESWVR